MWNQFVSHDSKSWYLLLCVCLTKKFATLYMQFHWTAHFHRKPCIGAKNGYLLCSLNLLISSAVLVNQVKMQTYLLVFVAADNVRFCVSVLETRFATTCLGRACHRPSYVGLTSNQKIRFVEGYFDHPTETFLAILESIFNYSMYLKSFCNYLFYFIFWKSTNDSKFKVYRKRIRISVHNIQKKLIKKPIKLCKIWII